MQKEKLQEEAVPVRVYIDELQSRQQIVKVLEPLHLTEKALVLIKDRNALVLTEEMVNRLEQFGRMARIYGNFCEPEAKAVGRRINNRVTLVEEVVLPSEDGILLMKKGGNFHLYRLLSSEMSKEEYDKLKPLIGKGEDVLALILGVLDVKDNAVRCIRLLKAIEDCGAFPKIFADPEMTLDKLLRSDWDMVIVADESYEVNEQYENKVRKAGFPVFDIHIHCIKEGEEHHISGADIFHLVLDGQSVEWFGALHVRHNRVGEFKFDKDDLLVFYLGMNDVSWDRRSLEIRGKYWHKDRPLVESFATEFEKKQKAEVLTYGELLKELGYPEV